MQQDNNKIHSLLRLVQQYISASREQDRVQQLQQQLLLQLEQQVDNALQPPSEDDTVSSKKRPRSTPFDDEDDEGDDGGRAVTSFAADAPEATLGTSDTLQHNNIPSFRCFRGSVTWHRESAYSSWRRALSGSKTPYNPKEPAISSRAVGH
jgi:hypothetical protein